jgi:hypothetical protein
VRWKEKTRWRDEVRETERNADRYKTKRHKDRKTTTQRFGEI